MYTISQVLCECSFVGMRVLDGADIYGEREYTLNRAALILTVLVNIDSLVLWVLQSRVGN